ncbi:DNA cytosine methyltransferase [Coraliomargarita sp. W4R72]
MDFVEFFAGVGLVREGLSRDQWNCIWANDICADKGDTYTLNFGDDHFQLGDIWDVAGAPELVPNGAFLYTASFPCTDLSEAGSREGLAGAESGTLIALLEILRAKHRLGVAPPVIMLENVRGFLTSEGGRDVAFTVRALNELGYLVDIIELDASYFTPQSRQRVFLLAVERGLAEVATHVKRQGELLDYWWSRFHEEPVLRSSSLEDIIRNNDDLGWCLVDLKTPDRTKAVLADIIEVDLEASSELWWSDERSAKLFNQMSDRHRATLLEMSEQEEWSYGTVFRRMRKGRSMAEMRTDGIAGCLRTPRGGSSKQIVICAGFGQWRVRLLTPREYARLQGVRESFELPDNANKGYFAMGDAVCVPAIEYLSENVLLNLYERYRKMVGQPIVA